jgi:lipopolysaccharide export system protein LptA
VFLLTGLWILAILLVILALCINHNYPVMMKKLFAALSIFLICGSVNAKPVGNNTKLPVEVNADSLEVIQDNQKAIFSGNVVAKQGTLNISANKMTVYYTKKDGKEDKEQNSVSKVEAEGNVFLSTPTETAQGQTGLLDVKQNVVTLSGNVVLTSGKNVVKGEKLVYNVTTRQSRIVSGTTSNGTKKERVRGVFVPK